MKTKDLFLGAASAAAWAIVFTWVFMPFGNFQWLGIPLGALFGILAYDPKKTHKVISGVLKEKLKIFHEEELKDKKELLYWRLALAISFSITLAMFPVVHYFFLDFGTNPERVGYMTWKHSGFSVLAFYYYLFALFMTVAFFLTLTEDCCCSEKEKIDSVKTKLVSFNPISMIGFYSVAAPLIIIVFCAEGLRLGFLDLLKTSRKIILGVYSKKSFLYSMSIALGILTGLLTREIILAGFVAATIWLSFCSLGSIIEESKQQTATA